jgi:hypothetical protein
MKKLFILLFLFLTYIAQAQEKTYKVLQNDFIFQINISKNTSIITWSIAIFHKTIKLQTFDIESHIIYYNDNLMEDALFLEDENFDGYLDLRIRQSDAIDGQNNYFHWVYNSQEKLFVRNKELDKLTQPVFNVQTQTILSSWHTNSQEREEYYQYLNGKLDLVKMIDRQVNENDIWEEVITEKVNGKILISKKIIKN